MPWGETSVLEQRIRFVAAALQPGANRRALCRQFGIASPTAYKWLARYAVHGAVGGLTDRSRRPAHSPRQAPAELEAAVVAVRQQYGWGGRKLRPLLAAQGHQISAATIDRLIRRRGLTDPDAVSAPAPRRFTAPYPNALWQMDFKGQYRVTGEAWTFPFSVLDDHSRFALSLVALTGTARVPVQAALTACFEQYGVPEAVLCDHGVPWWNPGARHGLTQLAIFLLEQDIQIKHGRIAHPQTQGKIERFHRTLARRLRQWGVPHAHADFPAALDRFRAEYNDVRPHAALDQHTPASRYQPSARACQPHPRPWDYPDDHRVLRVNRTGAIWYDRRPFFVSEALAHKDVGVQVLGTRVLVRFRQTYVREWDLTTGHTTSMLTRSPKC